MERNEISSHEVRFYSALIANKEKWRTARELCKQAGIAYRTASAFAKKFSELGIIETAEVFPGHRYRLAPKAEKTNAAYTTRLRRAAEALEVSLG